MDCSAETPRAKMGRSGDKLDNIEEREFGNRKMRRFSDSRLASSCFPFP
jgi:hypothetical protein